MGEDIFLIVVIYIKLRGNKMIYSQYRLGTCHIDAKITEEESIKRQNEKRQSYLKNINAMIESLRKFEVFFLKNIKNNSDTLRLFRRNEYVAIDIKAKLNKDNSIKVVTTVDNNENTYVINSKEKIFIPKNAFSYHRSVALEKMPPHIRELDILREKQNDKQAKFYMELISILQANNILVNFQEFVHDPYRGGNPIWYWQSGKIDFNDFEIY